MDYHTSELVEARVAADEIKAAGRYPVAIAQLIELHEQKHPKLVSRKGIHILGRRYTDRYFGGYRPSDDEIRGVIQILQGRRWFRSQRLLVASFAAASRKAVFSVAVKGSDTA